MGDALLDLIESLRLPSSKALESIKTKVPQQQQQGKKLAVKRPKRYRSLSEFQGLDWVELLQR